MTPEEINEAVARKLGWSPPGPPPDSPTWKKPDGSYDFVPDYSTDIKAAWEIVESMKTRNRSIEIWSPMGDPHWVCRIYEGGEIIGGVGADTAPMAICLAFLKLP